MAAVPAELQGKLRQLSDEYTKLQQGEFRLSLWACMRDLETRQKLTSRKSNKS